MKFPDAEAMVRAWLAARKAPRKFVTKVPAERPPEFVRVWRTGGAAVNAVLDRPLITVQGWAGDSVTASRITGECRDELLQNAKTMPLVRGVEESSGLYFDPDPVSETDRYTFTIALLVRAQR